MVNIQSATAELRCGKECECEWSEALSERLGEKLNEITQCIAVYAAGTASTENVWSKTDK